MKKLMEDIETLDGIGLCEKCGSRQIVTSVQYLNGRPYVSQLVNGRPIASRWVCKHATSRCSSSNSTSNRKSCSGMKASLTRADDVRTKREMNKR